jgi:hypothetical protein
MGPWKFILKASLSVQTEPFSVSVYSYLNRSFAYFVRVLQISTKAAEDESFQFNMTETLNNITELYVT